MPRTTGQYRIVHAFGEDLNAFVPYPLPPADPPLAMDPRTRELHDAARTALVRLRAAGTMAPGIDWFLYGFVRKEAVITSRIEGTQATLRDLLTFETGQPGNYPDDVREVSNYLDALAHAREQLAETRGLALSVRLLRDAHRVLMRDGRGADAMPGEIRRSQNWIGGRRPGRALFVPPPADEVPGALSALERWLHTGSDLPPLVRAGLAHAQFETIHPFLDGNGRVGRLLIALLIEHWGLLETPLLYISVAFRREQQNYYARLGAIRTEGDWESWTRFFLDCVRDAADDGVRVAQALNAVVGRDRDRVVNHDGTTVAAVRLLERLPSHPIVDVPRAAALLGLTPPPARKAIELLEQTGVLNEITGRRRGRVYAYHAYLETLAGGEA